MIYNGQSHCLAFSASFLLPLLPLTFPLTLSILYPHFCPQHLYGSMSWLCLTDLSTYCWHKFRLFIRLFLIVLPVYLMSRLRNLQRYYLIWQWPKTSFLGLCVNPGDNNRECIHGGQQLLFVFFLRACISHDRTRAVDTWMDDIDLQWLYPSRDVENLRDKSTRLC